MHRKIQLFIEKYHMIERGDSLAVGVSGGADSVCLLRILRDLRQRLDFTLAVVHVEHGIRGEESRRDASFTEKLCADLGVPFLLFGVDAPECARRTGRGLEEAARELRYDCFRKACEQIGANRVAVAHHAGDNAETMLFHLVRGTGIRGLCGIRPVTELVCPGGGEEPECEVQTQKIGAGRPEIDAGKTNHENGLHIIRPLLCVTHEEIVSWLDSLGQPYCTDSTNADLTYSRNRIRERVLPELTEINAQTIPHMRRTAAQLEEICGYLDEAALQAGRGAYAVTEQSDGSRSVELFCSAFEAIHPFLRRHLLYLILCAQAAGGKDLMSFHVERVLDLLDAGVGKRVSLPHGITAERLYESILLYPGAGLHSAETAGSNPAGRELKIPGETMGADGLRIHAEILDFSEISQKIPEKRYTKWFDYDKIKYTVQLRGRQTGDYFQTDAAGGHKKLNRYFIDEKIPLYDRDRISLLADGAHVLWVIGYRISEAYKVTGETRRVLCVTVMRREE